MASRVWCNSDRRDGVGSMVVNGFDHGEGREMVGFCVDRLAFGIRRGTANSNTILDEPFVDGFCRMCHEDPAFEVGLCQYIR